MLLLRIQRNCLFIDGITNKKISDLQTQIETHLKASEDIESLLVYLLVLNGIDVYPKGENLVTL